MLEYLKGNWKTTVAAAVVALITFAQTLGWITPEQANMLTGIAVSLGFAVARDAGKPKDPFAG
jgi:hypothetical protein